MPFGYPLLVWPLALILTGVAGATSEKNPGGDRSWASRRSTASAPASRPEPPPGPAHLKGTVTASQKRPMKPAVDLRMAELLEPYEEPPGEFAWSMDRLHAMSSYDVYDLRFP